MRCQVYPQVGIDQEHILDGDVFPAAAADPPSAADAPAGRLLALEVARLPLLVGVSLLAAAAFAVSGCVYSDEPYYYGPGYGRPVYVSPPAVYYEAPVYRDRDHDHWRHDHRWHHDDD